MKQVATWRGKRCHVRSSFHVDIGRIQILVLTNCQAISTEIGTDSLKI